MPKIKTAFKAVPPGEVYPRMYEVGEEVEGEMAELAEQLGALEKKMGRPPKNKATQAPENK